jgi:hypothetical protein
MNAKFEKVTKVIEGKVTIELTPKDLAAVVEALGHEEASYVTDPMYVKPEYMPSDDRLNSLFHELNDVYMEAQIEGLYDIETEDE